MDSVCCVLYVLLYQQRRAHIIDPVWNDVHQHWRGIECYCFLPDQTEIPKFREEIRIISPMLLQ